MFGNRIEYVYTRDQGPSDHRWDVPILSEIRYIDYGSAASPSFLVKVVFDWEDRPDPFSSYRAGFEVRTSKRCHRIAVQVGAVTRRSTRSAIRWRKMGCRGLRRFSV